MNNSQRRLVHYIFLYACIEGLVVNIFYPNPLAYLPKDAMIAMLYFSMLSDARLRGGSIARFSVPFGVFAVTCVMFVVMPTATSLLGVGVALKQRLFYIPLMYAGYYYVRGDADIATLLRLITWSALPVALFGIFLFFTGPSALQAIGADYAHVFLSTKGAAGIDFWRVPGTFNSPAQYGSYLYTVGTLLVGFLLVHDLRPRDRNLILVTLACVLPALLTSGSRAPLALFFLSAGIVAVMSRRFGRAGIVGAITYFVVVISLSYFGAGVGDRVGSIATQDNLTRFNETFFGQLFLPQLLQNPLGVGLGSATIGARHFSPDGTVQLVESYLGLLSTEMGWIGLLAFVFLAWQICQFLIRNRRWMANAAARPIWNAAFTQILLTVLLCANSTGLDGIPLNLYFWFLFGMTVRLVDIERMRATHARSAAPSTQAYSPYGGVVAR